MARPLSSDYATGMIRRRVGNEFFLIAQNDHAVLAGQFAAQVGNDQFARPPDKTIQATALHDAGFEIAIETNGTRLPPPGVDWICVSPKAGAEFVLRSGDELKLVYPQQGAEPVAPPAVPTVVPVASHCNPDPGRGKGG